MNKKVIVISCALLLATALAFSVIPVAAGGQHRAASAAISVSDIEARVVKIRVEAKLDALLAKGITKGRITPAQASEIKAYWAVNHITAKQISIADIEARVVKVQDGAKLDALLAKGVASGRITPAQAAEIKAYWTANHK